MQRHEPQAAVTIGGGVALRANQTRVAESAFSRARSYEADLSNNEWRGDDQQFYQLIAYATRAEVQPEEADLIGASRRRRRG